MTKQLLPHAAQLPPRQRRVAGASRRDPSERAIASLGLRMHEPLRGWLLLPLPLGEGGGEGTGRWMRRAVPKPHALTPTLSQREREQRQAEGQGCAAALLTRFPGPLCMRRGAQRLAEKGPRMFERSEFARTPPAASTAGCPVAKRRGRRQWGRLSFAYFSLAKQRKVGRPPGRNPGPRTQTNNKAKTRPQEATWDSSHPPSHKASGS